MLQSILSYITLLSIYWVVLTQLKHLVLVSTQDIYNNITFIVAYSSLLSNNLPAFNMATNLDTATEDQLLGLTGVGAASAKNILKHLKSHRTITTLEKLLECAPHLDVESLKMQHSIGTWTSNIPDLQPGFAQKPDTPELPHEHLDDSKSQAVETDDQAQANKGTTTDKLLQEILDQQIAHVNAVKLLITKLKDEQKQVHQAHVQSVNAQIQEGISQLRLEVRTNKVLENWGAPNKAPGQKEPTAATAATPQEPKSEAPTSSKVNLGININAGAGQGLGARSKLASTKLESQSSQRAPLISEPQSNYDGGNFRDYISDSDGDEYDEGVNPPDIPLRTQQSSNRFPPRGRNSDRTAIGRTPHTRFAKLVD